MSNIEIYWELANNTITVLNFLLEGSLFSRFVKPFIKRRPYLVGGTYSAIMLVLYYVPWQINYPYLKGIFVTWSVMCLLEKRNIKQKVLLATLMYLLRWVVYGVTLILRDVMFALFINTENMYMQPMRQLFRYVIVETIYYGIALTALYIVIGFVHKVYVYKKEEVAWKELLLLFAILLTVMVGYFTFNFFLDVYLEDLDTYIWNVHPEYTMLRVIYQIVSFVAIFVALVIHQKLKEKQREEKENILLAEQMENTKRHIAEVEKLYGDIRALKHDIGNHICVLENLLLRNETTEAEKYLAELKDVWNESMDEIKTGNPVTDVILNQKQKEANREGIDFICKFVYPVGTNLNAFDISVVLNNAIANAFEGVQGCAKPYVSIVTYRRKNAYLLEVTNSIHRKVEMDQETGLPETTKMDKKNHGFGLSNIRKVAKKYYGDLDISQNDNCFTLTVMFIVEV